MPQHSQILNEYWLPGFGLSKPVVLSQLQYFLGPQATVRPFTYHGRDGYLIRGIPLTREQIEDLKHQSSEYETQQAIRLNNRTARQDGPKQEPFINDPIIVGPPRRSDPHLTHQEPYSSRHSADKRYWR